MKFILISAAALFCLTGCSATGLVHDKYYVRAASVTHGDKVGITFSFFSGEETVSAYGDTIDEALEAAQLRAGKQIFTGYTELIVMDGDSTADTLEYMLEEWKVSPSCIAAYSDAGSELLRYGDPEQLRGSVEEAVRLGRIGKSGAVDVLEQLLSENKAEIAGVSELGFCGTVTINK